VRPWRGRIMHITKYVNVLTADMIAHINDAYWSGQYVKYEVPVDANAEGRTETGGPEIFGTISFKIESVLKGDVQPGSTLPSWPASSIRRPVPSGCWQGWLGRRCSPAVAQRLQARQRVRPDRPGHRRV
jgi:hypothetical protein